MFNSTQDLKNIIQLLRCDFSYLLGYFESQGIIELDICEGSMSDFVEALENATPLRQEELFEEFRELALLYLKTAVKAGHYIEERYKRDNRENYELIFEDLKILLSRLEDEDRFIKEGKSKGYNVYFRSLACVILGNNLEIKEDYNYILDNVEEVYENNKQIIEERPILIDLFKAFSILENNIFPKLEE